MAEMNPEICLICGKVGNDEENYHIIISGIVCHGDCWRIWRNRHRQPHDGGTRTKEELDAELKAAIESNPRGVHRQSEAI